MGERRQTDPTPSAERPRLRQRHWLLLGLVVVVALSLVYLWQSWRWVSTYNDLQAAQTELAGIQAERQTLNFRVERAFSLERVEDIATQQLDMFRPEPRFIDLSERLSERDQP